MRHGDLSEGLLRAPAVLAGTALVLRGEAEAWVEAGVQIRDIAALRILVEEAGGRFTDLDGKPTHASGSCIASNGLVHFSARQDRPASAREE